MKLFVYIVLLFFVQINLYADNVTITNSLYDEKFTYTNEDNIKILSVIEGDFNEKDLKDFKVESNSDYRFLGIISDNNTSKMTSIKIINGKYTKVTKVTMQIIYAVRALHNGKITLKSPTLKYKGKTVVGNDLYIKVIDKKELAKALKEQQNSKNEIPDFWFRLVPSKLNSFTGEELTLRIDFGPRTDVPIGNINLPDIEKIKKELTKGFIVKQLFESTQDIQKTQQIKIINNKRYRIYSLKYVLYPIRGDKYFIGPFSLKYTKIERSRSSRGGDPFFNMFFDNQREVTKEANSNMIELSVKDNGVAAGKYKISYSINKKEIKSGEPVNVTIFIKGKGNIKSLSLPEWRVGDEFSVYPPEINYSFNQNGENGFISNAKIKYLLVPKFKGEYKLPDYKVPYYNIKTSRFDTLKISGIKLSVKKGKNSAMLSISSQDTSKGIVLIDNSKKSSMVFGKKLINYIITDSPKLENEFYKSKNFVIAIILLLLLNILVVLNEFIKRVISLFFKKDYSVNLVKEIKNGKSIELILENLTLFLNQISGNKLRGYSFEDIISTAKSCSFEELIKLAEFGQMAQISKYSNGDEQIWNQYSKKEIIGLIKELKRSKKWAEFLYML